MRRRSKYIAGEAEFQISNSDSPTLQPNLLGEFSAFKESNKLYNNLSRSAAQWVKVETEFKRSEIDPLESANCTL